MRTVYLGTSEFAVAVLERLAHGAHRPELVVTRPDRRKGRGRRTAPPPVAAAARELGIPLFQPDDVNNAESRERIAATRPEAVCICAYGALIREPLLSAHPMLNVHPSLLPRWRGAAPVERAIEAGDEVTGVSIMRPVAEMDAGPVCLVREEPVGRDDDYGSLAARLAELGGAMLVEALDSSPPFREQPQEGVRLAPRIEATERRLDPARPAAELERVVRAFSPHIATWAELPDGGRLGVRRAAVAEAAVALGGLAAVDGRILLGCAEGALDLLEVQPPGGRAMDAASFLRGRPLPAG